MITNDVGWMVGEGGTALKTTDGGLTWNQQPMPYPTLSYWDVSFVDTSFGYICCNTAIVLKTTNGGGNWQIQQAGDTRSLFTIYAFDTLWASAAGFAGKVVYTNNGGTTWLNAGGNVSAAEINKIKFINDTTGFMACSNFYQSTDKGMNWFYRDDFTVSGTAPLTTNISFPNRTTGYFVGGGMLLAKTIDEGESWKRTIVNSDFLNAYFKNEQSGFINSSQFIYTTNDGGYTLDTLDSFPYTPVDEFNGMVFLDSLTGFAGYGTIYKTTDGGLNWYATNGAGGRVRKFFFINSNIGWAVSPSTIYKTIDGGENWFQQFYQQYYSFTSIFFIDSMVGWATILSHRPFKTTDGGNNWIEQTNLSIYESDDIYFKNSLNGWILSGNKLFRTIDGGNIWFQDMQISAYTLRFKPISDSHFIITGNIYESIDTGNTWTNITPETGTGFSNLHAPYNYFCIPVGTIGLVMNYIDTTIVPVELSNFAGKANNLRVLLSWRTITEKNNYGFEIQRSTNKIVWAKIGFVSGSGTTTEIHNYLFEDNDIETQIYYYRLKQQDYDGSFKYSNIIEIKISLNNFELFQNYPNPANPTTKIKYIVPMESFIELYLYDIKGEKISTLLYEKKQPGIYTKEINLRNLSSGVYFYTLKSSTGFAQTKKLLILK